jgi:hypothetical protein
MTLIEFILLGVVVAVRILDYVEFRSLTRRIYDLEHPLKVIYPVPEEHAVKEKYVLH